MDVAHGFSTSRLTAVDQLLSDYVGAGKIPGYICLISRNSKECGYFQGGMMDIERQKPVARDTIFRIYSMTKPLTSIAVMQLWEQGRFQLDDPVANFIPQFASLQVYSSGSADNFSTVAPKQPMTIRHLLTHMSGFTYGFQNSHVVDELYRNVGVDDLTNCDSLAQKVDQVLQIPLQFSPGEQWNYGVSTDALGFLVEVISGKPLDTYISDHITDPLGMIDTEFHTRSENAHRLAACYQVDPQTGKMLLMDDPATSPWLNPPSVVSGGGGMVSTVDDYQRFVDALLAGGKCNGNRIIKQETLLNMTRNHLPDGHDLNQMGQSLFSETTFDGVGFGLGFSVLIDPIKSGLRGSIGEYGWGGAASTWFMIDPVEKISVVLMTQLMPSSAYPIRRELKATIYQALVPQGTVA